MLALITQVGTGGGMEKIDGVDGKVAHERRGVPVARVKRRVYAISGMCAGLAGLVVIAINSASDANLVGLGMEVLEVGVVAVG